MAAENDGAEIPEASWPTYEAPSGIPREGSEAAQPPTPPVTPPVAATPPADGTPPAQPPAVPPAAPTGGASGQPPADSDVIPKYRLDEQRERFEAVIATQTAQIERLTALVERTMAGRGEPPAAPATPPAPPSPEDLKIRERLLSVFPELKLLDELKELAAKKQDLLGAASAVPAWRQAETAYYDRYAETTLNSIYDKLAVIGLGEGKTGKDFDDLAKGGLLNTFSQWVTRDPQRAARYEAQDPKVVDEFVAAYKASVYDPVRRDRNAELLTRAQTPPAIPQGGPATPPAPPAVPPALNLTDEDAVHAHAWATRDTVGTR